MTTPTCGSPSPPNRDVRTSVRYQIVSRSLRARGRSRNGEPGRVPLVGEASRCVTGRGVRVIKACRTSRPNGCPGLQVRTGTDASDARTSVRRGSFCLGGTPETSGSATRPVAGVPSPLKNRRAGGGGRRGGNANRSVLEEDRQRDGRSIADEIGRPSPDDTWRRPRGQLEDSLAEARGEQGRRGTRPRLVGPDRRSRRCAPRRRPAGRGDDGTRAEVLLCDRPTHCRRSPKRAGSSRSSP
jgi:hypothetical protein